MKEAAARKAETEKPAPATEKKATPAPVKPENEVREPSAYEPSRAAGTVSLEALNYVGPLTELIKFNENKFKGLEITISEWDKQSRGFIADINKVKDQMLQVENELRMKKNADTKAFSDDIISLKGKLEAYRKNYRQTKDIMVKGGATIVKNLETMSSDAARDLSKAYSEASQQVGSINSNPESGEKPVPLTYTWREVSDNCISNIVYMNDLLAWHQNEIRVLNDVINDWNPRVTKIISEDAQLKSQLEPIEKRLQDLSSNQKQNKAEISALKKQISDLEKSRKKVADQMKDDAKELASYIKQMSQKNQDSLKERFTDIIENITYSFGEKLSM
jgi:predicted  nucleic acid-binding Zn-ribbon protein